MIEVDDVAKTFVVRQRGGECAGASREVNAVAGLSFSVTAGEMVGYIGAERCREIDHHQNAHRN